MGWLTWSWLQAWAPTGTAAVRIVLGLVIMFHGWEQVAGGAGAWTALGRSGMTPLGVDFGYTGFGAAAAFIQFFGGFMVVVGFATRPVSLLIAVVLAVATFMHLGRDEMTNALHAIATGAGFVHLMFIGGGGLSVDQRLEG